jgi:hypothetical protein
MKTYSMFVYRVPPGKPLDLRIPISGITLQAMSEEAAVDQGFTLAYDRFPHKPGETLAVAIVTDRTSKYQVQVLEDNWVASLRTFEELMTVKCR